MTTAAKPIHELVDEITFSSFVNDLDGAHIEARWERMFDGINRKFCVRGNSFGEIIRKVTLLMSDWENPVRQKEPCVYCLKDLDYCELCT